MEHIHSLEANSRSASQEILCLLWNLKVHNCVHNIDICPETNEFSAQPATIFL
jgi:hypothetical protein